MNDLKTAKSPWTSLIWPALIGATLPIPVELIGTLYVGEILLLGALFHALLRKHTSMKKWPRLMRPLALSMLLMIVGYLLSDLIVGAPAKDMMRGSARVIFVLIDVFGMAAVVGYSGSRLQAVALGYAAAAGALALAGLSGQPFLAYWKLDLGVPVTMAVALVLGNLRLLKTALAPLAFMALGMLHVYLDSRSQGALCVAVGAVLLANLVRASRWRVLAWPATFAALGLAALLVAGSLLNGSEFSERRANSDTWRLAGVQVAAAEIFSSPLIGHGSWATNANLLDAVNGKQRDNGYQANNNVGEGTFQAHSMVLQAWFEGGLLALIFPVLYGVAIVRGIRAVWQSERHVKNPQLVLLLLLFTGLVHLLSSPFNGGHRLDVAFALCAFIVANGWLQAAQTAGRRRMIGNVWIRRQPAMAGAAHLEYSPGPYSPRPLR
ncbi:MAG TPA: O-antigen ligase family protein [Candidatus Acidoferrales bacterium]|jgi:hypothetical protein|nr:O-antigen ligase family protein [Candidatus Acidoferrales bacterium]